MLRKIHLFAKWYVLMITTVYLTDTNLIYTLTEATTRICKYTKIKWKIPLPSPTQDALFYEYGIKSDTLWNHLYIYLYYKQYKRKYTHLHIYSDESPKCWDILQLLIW